MRQETVGLAQTLERRGDEQRAKQPAQGVEHGNGEAAGAFDVLGEETCSPVRRMRSISARSATRLGTVPAANA